jgi:hypothetical protein
VNNGFYPRLHQIALFSSLQYAYELLIFPQVYLLLPLWVSLRSGSCGKRGDNCGEPMNRTPTCGKKIIWILLYGNWN